MGALTSGGATRRHVDSADSDLLYGAVRDIPAGTIAIVGKYTADTRFGLWLVGEDFHFAVLGGGAVERSDGAKRGGLIGIRHFVVEQGVIPRV